uniref:Uncharacterized protein n=1 Tax=Rhizophora mucronata TaxID=61149 RepID=A0A2P2Q7G3_RHIMU
MFRTLVRCFRFSQLKRLNYRFGPLSTLSKVIG